MKDKQDTRSEIRNNDGAKVRQKEIKIKRKETQAQIQEGRDTDKRHKKTIPDKGVVDSTDKRLEENRLSATATEDGCGYFTTPLIT